jgi:Flp pilus assembly protein TadG
MIGAAPMIESLRRRVSGFAGDQRAVSAVEFAIMLPLMLSVYLGAVELSQGISATRKVTLTARTVADLVSQVSTVNNADITNSLNAAAAVIAPFSVANLKVTVSSVLIDANGNATVAWSETLHGTAHSVGATITLPAGLNGAGTSLIWSEVEYAYKPTIGYVVTNTLTLKDQSYMRPRLSPSVARVNS